MKQPELPVMKQPDFSQVVGGCLPVSPQVGGTVLEWLKAHCPFAESLVDRESVAELERLLATQKQSGEVLYLEGAAGPAYQRLIDGVLEIAGAHSEAAGEKPRYIKEAHTLVWRGEVILELGRSAERQEPLFEAFEAVRWAQPVDNPYLGDGEDAAQILRQTVRNINVKLRPGTISFHTDGFGHAFWRAES